MNIGDDSDHDYEAAERDRCADRLWVELMDWCQKRKVHPSDYNDLFAIVGRIRGETPAGVTPEGVQVNAQRSYDPALCVCRGKDGCANCMGGTASGPRRSRTP